MFTNDEDRIVFDNWSKEHIYKAYLAEYNARKQSEQEANKLREKLKEIEFLVTRIVSGSSKKH